MERWTDPNCTEPGCTGEHSWVDIGDGPMVSHTLRDDALFDALTDDEDEDTPETWEIASGSLYEYIEPED